MNIHLAGASLICAQGENRAVDLKRPRPPANRIAHMLGEQQALPYFSAFSCAPMPLPALYPLLEQHLEQAAADAGWTESSLRQVPVFLGSTVYVMADREHRAARAPLTPSYSLTEIARHLQIRYRNPHIYSLATSCTASAHGIAQAAMMIANGFCERALVLGFETFNRMSFEHFHAMSLLAPSGTEPGIILGEAIACVALARAPHPCRSPVIRHLAAHTDHGNLTQNSAAALHTLLDRLLAHTPAHDISGVKIHGAGGQSDAMEDAVLDERLPHPPRIRYKAHTGHTLGATGALETALTLQQALPPGRYLHYFLGFGGSHVGWILECA